MCTRPLAALLATTLALAADAAIAQEPPRLIGLVELAGLFGVQDPDGPPGAMPPARVEPVPVHEEPGEGEPFRMVAMPQAIEWHEHDYEAPAALAFDAQDGWVMVALREGEARRYGWVPPTHAGPLHRLETLLVNGLAYLTTEWDGRLFDAADLDAASARFEPSSARTQRAVNVLRAIERDGVLWLRVELLGPGRCETVEPPEVEATGWLRALAPDGRPNAWFYSRGC
jgi:hypothetical protein